MPRFELLVRGGRLIGTSGPRRADLAVEGGRIAVVEAEIESDAEVVLDATGLDVYPSSVDVHVHFNEPGRSDWEGLASGTAALLAGGGASCLDMPLNSSPPVTTPEAFDAKAAAVAASARADVGLWGGLTPDALPRLPELAARGVVGFKAFMADSGIDDFARADDRTLLAGMHAAAELGLPVAVHAESETLTRALTAEVRARGGRGWRDWGAARPVVAELDAIQRALLFAEESGCRLHVVHVSCARGVALVREAQTRGVDVSCETCPHYLVFDETDLERLGAPLKCAPPLRSPVERAALWEALAAGEVDLVASDHSPAPPERKNADDVFEVWGGISGVQSTLSTLLTVCAEGRLEPVEVARLTAATPARRFRLAGKGRLEVGADADLTLVDPAADWTLEREALLDRHRLSPYVGRRFRGRVRTTVLRGEVVFDGERIVGEPRGRLLRPEHERAAAPNPSPSASKGAP